MVAWSKLFSAGAKFIQKAAPKLVAAGERLLPKVTAVGEKVMGKVPGLMAKAQDGIVKAWGKTGSFLASPATKSTIEGVGNGVAKGFGKVGTWMASHPLGTAKLAATGFVGLEANKFLTNTTGKGLAEHVAGGAKAIDDIANGKQAGAQMGTQAANQFNPANLVNGIMSTVSNVFGTVSNVVGGLVGDKNMGGVLTALGVGAAGVFGLKRVGILAPLAIAGAGLFAANQAGLFKGAQQPGSPLALAGASDLSRIAFAPYAGTGAQTGTSSPSMGVSGLQVTQGSILSGGPKVATGISELLKTAQSEIMARKQAESGLTAVERDRLAQARERIALSERRFDGTSIGDNIHNMTPEQRAARAAKNERLAWKIAGVEGKMPIDYSADLASREYAATTDSRWGSYDPGTVAGLDPTGGMGSRSKSPFFGSDNPVAMSASGKSALDVSQMLSGAGLASGVAAASSSLESESKPERSTPSVTVEADTDEVSTKTPDLGPTQLA